MSYLFISLIIAFSTYILCLCYRKIAIQKGVTANLNFRTLHKKVTPKGGGIVFSLIFLLLAIFPINIIIYSTDPRVLVAAFFGLGFSLFGLIDDYRDLSSSLKLIIQLIFSIIILFLFFPLELFINDILSFSIFLFLILLLVWTINTVNFMDGIDGLAASLCMFFFLSTFLITYLLMNEKPLFECLILFSSCLGFLLINFSKNNLFMGDSGSLFLGFMVCFISIKTVHDDILPVWYWLILLSYCFTETTATTIYRILFVKKWYGAHRSHAYQNLARIKKNHWKITSMILAYHIIWLAPLAYFTIFIDINPLYLLILAILPTLIFNMTFGPRFSSK